MSKLSMAKLISVKGSFKSASFKLLSVLVSVALCVSFVPIFSYTPVAFAYTSNNSDVSAWDAYLDDDGLHFTFEGTASDAWFSYFDGSIVTSAWESKYIGFKNAAAAQSGEIYTDLGVVLVPQYEYGSSNGDYKFSVFVPASAIGSTDFTLTMLGQTLTSAELSASSGNSDNTDSDNDLNSEGSSGVDTTEESSGDDSAGSIATAAEITIDADLSEWDSVATIASNDSQIDYWQICKDEQGNVYFSFTGTAVSQWDGNYQWKCINVTQNGSTATLQISGLNWLNCEVSMVNQANGNTAAPYYVEVKFPASYFTDSNAIITFAGADIQLSQVPLYKSAEDEGASGVYEGIVIDGKFKDWDAVQKSDAHYTSSAGNDVLDSVAMVFDGDMVYLYLKENAGYHASGAGENSNGMFSITTDLGNELLFQLNRDDTVSGLGDSAQVKHVGNQWEIAFPASLLPSYLETINFGCYLMDPFVKDVSNLNGEGSGGSFDGIVYDGLYGDWEFYPHTTIEYATSGTHDTTADSKGALYADDSTLYGHVYSDMSAHVSSQGGDFLAAVSIAFNGDRDYKDYPEKGNFYPKFFMVDENGNITVVNEGTKLSNGTHTIYISDTRSASLPSNIADLDPSLNFGEMKLTVSDDSIEAEFELDLEKVAAYIGADVDDFKIIEIQWGRLGQQWITYAGTSTGPLTGIFLCVGTVAGVLAYRRQKLSSVSSCN